MYPIYINNRNRLTSTRNLLTYLMSLPDALPIIIDNASSYPPLLEWYETRPVEVIRLPHNVGPKAPWSLARLDRGRPFYVVTDSDLDLDSVPKDVLQHLQSGLDHHPAMRKAGLSLEIKDLPQGTRLTEMIHTWESQFWETRLDLDWWLAAVDTTFAMYRAGDGWGGTDRGSAIRADRPYTARHLPWYNTQTEEDRYYIDHCNLNHSMWFRIGNAIGAFK